jgi:alpha-1,6-mannosyltransferase
MAQMGINARCKTQEHFDWDQVMPQILLRYDSLLAGGRAALGVERICVTD